MFTHSFNKPRSRQSKKLLDLTVFFALLGSVCVKAERKMLVKLTPGANFTNILLVRAGLNIRQTSQSANGLQGKGGLRRSKMGKKWPCKVRNKDKMRDKKHINHNFF